MMLDERFRATMFEMPVGFPTAKRRKEVAKNWFFGDLEVGILLPIQPTNRFIRTG